MSILNRESFLRPAELAREPVEVPDLGGTVYVRTMTAGERDRYEREQFPDGRNSGDNLRARLAAYTVCDEAGVLLFTAADIPALSGLPAGPMSTILAAALRLNKLGDDSAKDLEKN